MIALHPLRIAEVAHLPRTAYARGVLYATAAGIAMGTLGPLSNIAYAAGMSSAAFAAMRATVGAVTLIALIAFARPTGIRLRDLNRHEVALLSLTAVAQAALSLSLFAAYGQMAVALVLAVYFCYPLLVSGASIALGRERLTRMRAAALAIALTGLVAVVLGRAGSEVALSLGGLALAGFAAACQATYLVTTRSGFTRVPSEKATALILSGAAVLMWTVALPVEITSGRTLGWVGSPAAWLAIGGAGVLGAALAKVWMLRGVRRVGGTRASVLMLTEPLTGVLLAGILLSQGLAPIQVVGGIGVLVGASLAQRPAPART